ncbi:MAG: hypothetical protein AAB401_05960 [Acidobacteriota bacterium]
MRESATALEVFQRLSDHSSLLMLDDGRDATLSIPEAQAGLRQSQQRGKIQSIHLKKLTPASPWTTFGAALSVKRSIFQVIVEAIYDTFAQEETMITRQLSDSGRVWRWYIRLLQKNLKIQNSN